MAKKDLSTDKWELDSDLDFDFGNEINTGLSQESSKKRSAIASVAVGVGEGVKDAALSPGVYQKLLRAALPSHYGDIATGATEISTGLYELYDQTQKEVKPRLNRITKSIDKIIPAEAKLLKKLTGKIMDLTDESSFSDYTAPDQSAQEDQAVALMMGDIFKAQQVQGKINESREVMRDAIANKRYAKEMDVSTRMQRDISIIQQYTTNVTQAFQKKSLELQLRTYLGQRAYFTKSLDIFGRLAKQGDAIVKNTSLPDAAKITEMERLKTIGKEKLYGGLYGEGSTIKKGFERIKSAASNAVQGAMFRLDMGDMAANMIAGQMDSVDAFNQTLESMGMPPMTREQVAGALATSWAIDRVTDWAGPELQKIVKKNPDIARRLAHLAGFFINPGGKISTFREGAWWKEQQGKEGMVGKGIKLLDWGLDQFMDGKTRNDYKTGNGLDDLSKGHGFDKKAHLSLTTVIPGYLSMIHHEIASIRNKSNQPFYRFDYQAGKFKTDKQIAKEIESKLVAKAKSSFFGMRLDESVNFLTEDVPDTNEQEKSTLRTFMSTLSREPNIDYTTEGIEKSKAYRNLDPESQRLVRRFVDRLEASDDREIKLTEFSKKAKDLRDSVPMYSDTLADMVKAGHGDALVKLGHLKETEDGYSDNSDHFHEFTEKHAGTVSSDMNVKEGIKRTTPSELLKSLGERAYTGMKKTKIYDWIYKKGKGDRAPHSGPMAQDVQKNLGDEAAPGGKEIDLQTMNGSFFAAIHYLGDKVENLFKGKKTEESDKSKQGKDPIKNIDKNVARIAAMIAAGNGIPSGGSGGTGGRTGYREGFDLNYFLDKGVDGAKAVGGGISKGVGAVSSKIAEIWGNNKDKLKEKAVWLFNKGSELAGTVFDASKNFITNILPDWVGKAKDFGKKVMKAIGEQFETIKDLYLPDGTEPVIRAAKLKAGEYYDELEGVVITSAEQLAKVKGNIVDKAGNIVVSSKELAVGLYDRYGEKVRDTAGKIAAFAISGAKWVGGRLMQAAGQLKDMVTGGVGKIKEWWANSPEFKLPDFGVSFYDKKNLAELINIRDILLGDVKAVRKRVRKADALKATGGGGKGESESVGGKIADTVKEQAANLEAKYAAPGSFLGNLLSKAKGLGGKAAAMATVATRSDDFVGPMSREEMEAKAAIDAKKAEVGGRFSWLKEKLLSPLNKGKVNESFIGPQPGNHPDNFIGPQPSASQSRKLAAGKLWDKAKGAGGKLFKGAKGRLGALAGMAGGLLGGNAEQQASPGAGVDGVDGKTDQEKEAAAHAANIPAVVRSKRGQVAAKDRQAGDNDGDGVKDGSVEDRRNKLEELKASRDKGTLAADTSTKYKSPENVLDTIAKKASGLMGTLTSGLGTVFDVASMMFSGGKAVAKGAYGALKGLAKGASALNAATGGTGRGAMAVVRGLWTGARLYGAAVGASTMAAGGAIAGMASMAATAAASVAGAVLSVIMTPAVIIPACVALAGYGLYWLYKYANRDSASDMERLRLRQYGFGYNTSVDRYNHHVYMLEAYLQDGRIAYDAMGNPSIISKKVDIKELLSIFEIDEKDTEAVTRFNAWVNDRFKPVFFAHLSALFKVDKKKKLHEVNDLSAEQKLGYLERAKFPNGPYDKEISPFGDKLALDTNAKGLMESYDNLILIVDAVYKKLSKSHKGIEKPKEESKAGLPDKEDKAASDQKVNAAKAAAANQEANAGKTDGGEGDGSSAKTTPSAEGKVTAPGSINMAPGSIADGANGMQFVKLGKGSRLDGLSPAMLKQFLGMAEEYGNMTGKAIPVNDGVRTFEEQKALYAKNPGKAAKPGRSLHEFGLAIDINQEAADELDKLGLMKKYGFTRPVGKEPWHVEPAGIQRSIDLAKNNQAQREMMVEQSVGRGGGGYGTVDGAPLGKRNHELAMKLLGTPSKIVENKTEEAKGAYTAANDDAMAKKEEKPTTVTVGSVKTASVNPTIGKASELPQTKVSDTNAAANQGTTSPDAEGGPKSVQTVSASGSANTTVEAALQSAAQKTGVNFETLKSFAAVESGMDPNAKSNSSSAQGLMQFMPDTWREVVSKYGSRYGIPANASPFNAEYASLMGAEYLKSNMRILSSVRPNMNVADMYITHLLGATGARRFFQADPSQPSDLVIGKQAQANASLFYANGKPLTIAEAYDRIKQRVAQKASAFGLKANTSGPGLKAPKPGESSQGIKLPASGGVEPNLSGDSPSSTSGSTPSVAPSTPAPAKRGFNFDNTSAGYVPQSNQSGQRNDSPSNKLETLMEKSNDTAQESLKALQNIVTSLSEERLTKVLAAVMAMVPQQESKEEAVKAKDKENMGRTATARGSSLDLKRRASA